MCVRKQEAPATAQPRRWAANGSCNCPPPCRRRRRCIRTHLAPHTLSPADTDVAYAAEPVWDSYLAFIEQAQADGAWQQEGPGGALILLSALPSRRQPAGAAGSACAAGCLPQTRILSCCCRSSRSPAFCVRAANTGHFVLLPTPAALSFAAGWIAAAPAMLAENLSEQSSLLALEGMHFVSCSTLCKCYSAAHNVSCSYLRPAWQQETHT